jgi:molybdate transport system substrate-binding protein
MTRTTIRARFGVVSGALVVALGVAPAAASTTRTAGPSGDLTIAAASSLTEAFDVIGERFESKHPDVSVTFNYGSSATLAAQLEQGAPGDVFASADTATMDALDDSDGLHGAPVVFARNRLAIAVEPGNPKRIRTLADTVADDVRLVLCAPEVPCGKYALDAYRKADVGVPTVPTGLTAKDTLSKVSLGEADAAVVYVTDVEAAARDVDGVTIPATQNVLARYPIAVVADAANPAGARPFVKYVLAQRGQAVLRRFGFLPP